MVRVGVRTAEVRAFTVKNNWGGKLGVTSGS